MTETIVSSSSFITETQILEDSIIYTAPADGLFFIRLYGESHGGWVEASLKYTDDFEDQCITQAGFPWSPSFLVRLRQGTAVSISAKINSGTPTYSIYTVISQIS